MPRLSPWAVWSVWMAGLSGQCRVKENAVAEFPAEVPSAFTCSMDSRLGARKNGRRSSCSMNPATSWNTNVCAWMASWSGLSASSLMERTQVCGGRLALMSSKIRTHRFLETEMLLSDWFFASCLFLRSWSLAISVLTVSYLEISVLRFAIWSSLDEIVVTRVTKWNQIRKSTVTTRTEP